MIRIAFSQLKVHVFARILTGCCLLGIATALFFGRRLSKTFPAFEQQLPWLGILIISLILLITLRILSQRVRAASQDFSIKHAAKKLLFGLAVIIGLVFIGEQTIILKIERIHLIKYGTLALVVFFSFERGSLRKRVLISFLAAALVGTSEETIQLLLPERVFDLRDIALNILGAFLGSVLALTVWLTLEAPAVNRQKKAS